MSSADLRPRIERAVGALGASVDEASLDRVVAWCALVRETNARIDLTAARSDDELVDLLVADALVIAPRLPQGARVVDVGSGAGAPGLPIALLRPDLDMTLVEPLDKRVAFLRSAIGRAGLLRVPRVHRGRGETLSPPAGAARPFDVAISRATLPPSEWLALGAALAPDIWVLVARAGANTAAVEAEAVEAVDYVWPLTGAVRRALRATRRTP